MESNCKGCPYIKSFGTAGGMCTKCPKNPLNIIDAMTDALGGKGAEVFERERKANED